MDIVHDSPAESATASDPISRNKSWPWTLEEAYARALATSFPGDASDEARQALYADLKLQYDYPYEFVLFYDTWSEGDHGRLTRTVVEHNVEPKPLQELYAEYPERARLRFSYLEGPDDTEEEDQASGYSIRRADFQSAQL